MASRSRQFPARTAALSSGLKSALPPRSTAGRLSAVPLAGAPEDRSLSSPKSGNRTPMYQYPARQAPRIKKLASHRHRSRYDSRDRTARGPAGLLKSLIRLKKELVPVSGALWVSSVIRRSVRTRIAPVHYRRK